MRRLDRLDRLDILAAQRHGVRANAGLTSADTAHAVWCVAAETPGPAELTELPTDDADPADHSGGEVRVGGARAVGLALAVGRGARWPLLPWRSPLRLIGLPWLLDRLYEIVAANRTRLPGDTPWCVAHPSDCESREA